MNKYDNLNPNDFTQKDLMLHLLQVSQHTVTREELKEDNESLKSDLKEDIAELKSDLKEDITELKSDILELRTELKSDIQKVDAKFDRMQWLIVATILSVFFKDYILGLF